MVWIVYRCVFFSLLLFLDFLLFCDALLFTLIESTLLLLQ